MANMRAIEFLPNLLFAYILGIMVDRYNKKLFLMISHIVQILLIGMLAFSLRNNIDNIYPLYIITFMYMLFSYANGNLTASIVKLCLPKERVLPINTNLASVSSMLEVAAPLIAALALMLTDYTYSLYLVLLLLFLSIIAFSQISSDDLGSSRSNSSFGSEFISGFKILFANKNLFNLTIITMLFNTSIGFVYALLVFYAKDMFSYTDAEIGYVFSGIGLCTLIGARVSEKIRLRLGLGKMMSTSIFFMSLCYLTISMVNSEVVFVAGVGLASFFGVIFALGIWTYRIEVTPKEVIGKITGITGSLFKLGLPISAVSSGVIATAYSLQSVFLVSGISMLFLTLFCFTRNIHHIK